MNPNLELKKIAKVLNKTIIEKKLKNEFVAKHLNVSEKTLKRMLSGNYDFTLFHIVQIETLIGIDIIKHRQVLWN